MNMEIIQSVVFCPGLNRLPQRLGGGLFHCAHRQGDQVGYIQDGVVQGPYGCHPNHRHHRGIGVAALHPGRGGADLFYQIAPDRFVLFHLLLGGFI